MQQPFPEKNNFYASFSSIDKARLAEVFSNNGWDLRKCSWTDFELRNDWSELILEGEEKEPLMSGIVIFDQASINMLDAVLRKLDGHFVYEFYDDRGNLLLNKEKNREPNE